NRRVRPVAAERGARHELPILPLEEDHAAIGADELENRDEDLVEQRRQVALERDFSRKLVREAEALVVLGELLRVSREVLVGEEATVRRGDLSPDRARAIVHVDAGGRRDVG